MTTTTIHIAPAIGWPISTADVIETYRGRKGCGCGCRGTYSMQPGTVTRRVNEINRRSNEVTVTPMANETVCLSIEDGINSLWVFLAAPNA